MKNTEENKTQEEIMSPTDIVIVSPETTFDSSELGKTFVEKRDAALNELLSIENEKNLKREVLQSIFNSTKQVTENAELLVKDMVEKANSSGIQIGSNEEILKNQEKEKIQNNIDISNQIQNLSSLTSIIPEISEIVENSKNIAESAQTTLKDVSTEFPNFITTIKDAVGSIIELGETAKETLHYLRNDIMAIERAQNERNELLNKREEQLDVRQLAIDAMSNAENNQEQKGNIIKHVISK